jgi:hypothetical protein
MVITGYLGLMPIVRTVQSNTKVKVAVVFEPGQPMRPVWFEIAGQERVQVNQVCAMWTSSRGAARIITFEIWDSRERYSLSFDAQALTWSVGMTVIE